MARTEQRKTESVAERPIEAGPAEEACARHGSRRCACGMGNLFRFVEPLVLLELRNDPGASGYDILLRLKGHTLTGTTIDKAAVYRTLNVLEHNGMTVVEWTESVRGAGRKAYRLTDRGLEHLVEWGDLLDGLAGGLRDFAREARSRDEAAKR